MVNSGIFSSSVPGYVTVLMTFAHVRRAAMTPPQRTVLVFYSKINLAAKGVHQYILWRTKLRGKGNSSIGGRVRFIARPSWRLKAEMSGISCFGGIIMGSESNF